MTNLISKSDYQQLARLRSANQILASTLAALVPANQEWSWNG